MHLGLGGLDVDYVVLLQIVLRSKGDAGLSKVEMNDLTTTDGVFASELNVVAIGKEGHIACLGQGLKDVDAFVGDSKRTRMVNFAQYTDFEIVDADCDIGDFVEVGLQLLTDKVFALTAGKARNGKLAQNGIVDAALVVDQIIQQFGIARAL